MFNTQTYNLLDVGGKNYSNKLSSEETQKYAKLLNNLLGIKRSDSAIFTKLNSLNNDLLKIIKTSDLEKIFKYKDFTLTLERKLVVRKKRSEETIDDSALFIAKWKRYIKTCQETFEQTNDWPLFIGTFFIKGKLGDKTIYAPLALKEVELFIEDNEVKLKSRNSSCVLNEKLMFVLNEFGGIVIPKLKDDVDKCSLRELHEELNLYLNNTIEFESTNDLDFFNNLKMFEVKNERICRTSGLVLLFTNPLGGALRSSLVNIIKSGKIKNLINIETNDILASEEDKVKNIVYKPSYISRICPTDPSQEKAILESLKKHTIIVGPPGTGKSQTIANILCNIIQKNKKALFISQKRVALEVVLERMKSLQYFTLQLVEHKKHSNFEKNSFYDYLNNFINLISNWTINSFNQKDGTDLINTSPLVSKNWLEYWKSKDNNIEKSDLDVYYKLKNNNINISSSLINDVDSIFANFKKISRFDSINSLIDKNVRDFKLFVEKLNIEPKFKFLGIKKYDASIHKLFDENIKLLNVIDRYRLNNYLIDELKQHEKLNNLVELENIYHYHQNKIDYINKFYSNETEIRKVAATRARAAWDILHRADPSWQRKFTGRIERQFTQPSKFISLFKHELKYLFNIYVSTPEALSSFIDFEEDKFDYVIFDEASQIFLEKAIPYMSIADKVIIAGDDQQMQPSNWFGYRSDVDVEEAEEENIDSLLTYGIEAGIPKQYLELNYRSTLASLTTFSSKEFYESNLKTLDCNVENPINGIEVINVDGKWKNNRNEVEAMKAIEILIENIPWYKRIILLTLNAAQLDLVNEILSVTYPQIYNDVIEGNIILKNLENIQGDEADLVIVSVGYTKDAAIASTYVGRKGGRNALNVAITRAKNKMIVIKSLNSNDIRIKNENNLDLLTFKRWIQFLELTNEEQKGYLLKDEDNSIKDCDSGFEVEVINWLKTIKFDKEMKIVSQYPIGSYRIDVALLDAKTNQYLLGIEVDGFKYHSSLKQRYNDLVRQTFIEAKGYKLIRISELLWKIDKAKLKQIIFNELN